MTHTLLRRLVGMMGVLVAALVALYAYQYWMTTVVARAEETAHEAIANDKAEATLRTRALNARKTLAVRIPPQRAAWSWSEHLPPMMTQVGALMKASGAVVEAMQPAPAVTRQAVTRFPLRVTLSTNLASLTKLLRGVQEAAPVLAIDQLTIHPGEKPDAPLRVEMVLSSYVMADGKTTGGQR